MTDIQVLNALYMRDNHGMTFAAIADALGVTRSSVSGAFRRVDMSHQSCWCTKPENKDGGMPVRWWAKKKTGGVRK